MPEQLLACPLCQQPLIEQSKVLRCQQNHCFDRAKQGYWNLLVVQQKKSKDPGDNPQMVEARRNFLSLDHYKPLTEAIAELLRLEIGDKTNAKILDMGCGEGYYSTQWQKQLSQHQFIGLDISKHAIKAASQRNKEITWLVASGAKMPIIEESLDILTVVFSRVMAKPFAEVLKQQGLLIIVWPQKNHLIQLRETLYTDVKQTQYNPIDDLKPHFYTQAEHNLEFDFTLSDSNHLNTLLQMTPHGQRVSEDSKQKLLEDSCKTLTFAVNIGLFRKVAGE